MPHHLFDRKKLLIKKLEERKNRIEIERDHVPLTALPSKLTGQGLELIVLTAERIREAVKKEKPVILAFGAHTIKNGMAPALIALMKEGWITHLATNGAGIIHDWEFAFMGKSSEDVRENVALGQFGIWEETGFYINLALVVGAYEGLGYGESIGRMIARDGLDIPDIQSLTDQTRQLIGNYPEKSAAAADLAGTIRDFNLKKGFMQVPHPFKEFSVQAAAYDLNIKFTGHPMIGHDIIYTHPINNGAAVGRCALTDFLSFADSVSRIGEGVYISLGSAVMSPMIFEKSLSMAQNCEIQQNRHIDNHFILVVDLADSEWDWQKDGEPPSDNPAYYLRYCKTFNRMGGEMRYMTADNRDFLLALYRELNRK